MVVEKSKEVMEDKSNSPEKKVLRILRSSSEGKTITELTEISQLSRSAVRTALARLEGANKVEYKKIGMAKIYNLMLAGKLI